MQKSYIIISMKKYLVFLLAPFLGIITCIILDFNGLYGQDAHEYYRYTQSVYHSILQGKQIQDYLWGVGYPLLGTFLSFFTKNVLFSLQAISFISYTWIGILIYKTTNLLNTASVAPFPLFCRKIAVFLLYFSVPYCLRMSTLVMSDTLAALGITLCFYGLTHFYYQQKNSAIYVSMLGFTLALLTRYPTIVPIFPMFLALFFLIFKYQKKSAFLFSLLIPLMGFILHIAIKRGDSFIFMEHNAIHTWSFSNYFSTELHRPDGVQYCTFPNIIYAFSNIWHPAYGFFGLILLFFIWKKRENLANFPTKIALISIVLYSFFLAGIPLQNLRFLLLTFPLLSIVYYPAFEHCIELIMKYLPKWKYIIIIGLILGQSVAGIKLIHDFAQKNHWEKQVAADFQVYKGITLYTFDIDVAFGSYPVPLKIVNTWHEKVSDFEIGALYFCEEKSLESQFIGQNPLANWHKVQQEYALICLKTYQNGWKLYKIEKKL